ncbi:MAG: patatin-like phospholipase family protein [Anaerovoracaceae bacterium]|jgi:predicted patatin/cPLA2 family phospholipase
MIGLIDTGGGQRGTFGAGVLDWCSNNGIRFDHCVGVSAGAGNMVSYIAGQPGRNLRFYLDYSLRSEYMSVRNYFKKKAYIDMDYVYSVITNEDGEDPLDYDAFCANPCGFTVVATNADSGLPVYFDKADFARSDYFPLKASSCIPLLCKPEERDGIRYFDGGLSDPIPLKTALDAGCDKVVVILSRPRDFRRLAKSDAPFARMLRRRFPKSANALQYRYKTYNTQMEDLTDAEKDGVALILAPDTIGDLKTLSRDPATLQKLYWKGYIEADKIKEFIEN